MEEEKKNDEDEALKDEFKKVDEKVWFEKILIYINIFINLFKRII
jgi:hypothetical protein